MRSCGGDGESDGGGDNDGYSGGTAVVTMTAMVTNTATATGTLFVPVNCLIFETMPFLLSTLTVKVLLPMNLSVGWLVRMRIG